MAYQVRFSRAARKNLRRLSNRDRERVIQAAEDLVSDPRPRGAEPMKNTPGLLRIRVGDYRIIYQVQEEILRVLVVRVGHRREVYRRIT